MMWGYAVLQTDDGGYLVAGKTTSFGAGDLDVWLLKLTGSGEAAWSKTYGGSAHDAACALAATTDVNGDGQQDDPGFVIAGEINSFGSNSDAWVIAVDLE